MHLGGIFAAAIHIHPIPLFCMLLVCPASLMSEYYCSPKNVVRCPRHQPRASSCGRSFMAYVPQKLHHIAAHHRGEGFTDTLHAKFAEKLLAVVLHRVDRAEESRGNLLGGVALCRHHQEGLLGVGE